MRSSPHLFLIGDLKKELLLGGFRIHCCTCNHLFMKLITWFNHRAMPQLTVKFQNPNWSIFTDVQQAKHCLKSLSTQLHYLDSLSSHFMKPSVRAKGG